MPRERFERIAYAYADQVRLEDFLGEGGEKQDPIPNISDDAISALVPKVRAAIDNEPMYFASLAETFADDGFQAVARALGTLHETGELWQDKLGRFCLAGSEHAAIPPGGRG